MIMISESRQTLRRT